jgi:transaldolase
MSKAPMQQTAEIGQSLWLDYIDRNLLASGRLQTLINSGLRGLTSNPSIFNQAIGSSKDYDEKIIELKHAGKSAFEIYDELSVADIQNAADIFRGTYDKTKGLDGYVSLEIDPRLANKTDEQLAEGLRLYKKVNRPNLMVKVPATSEGFFVIEGLIGRGINVNATLIFSLEQYERTVNAYFKGLNRLLDSTDKLDHVRSVASVFVSRIDNTIDQLLEAKLKQESNPEKKEKLQSLKGKAAVANSRIIFEKFKDLFSGIEFKNLFERNANPQRVLWGSTGTKNPEYSDIKYISELIFDPTVNTVPEKTLMAFIDHGKAEKTSYPKNESQKIIADLKLLGIDISEVCADLLDAGVITFVQSFDQLLNSIEKKAEQLCIK